MKTQHSLFNTFLTTRSPSLHPLPTPTTTLAHIYANIHASSQTNSTMWRAQARPPLAHARSVLEGGEGGLTEELHSQYSMIAVVVLTALFFTITISATGLLLAFCKKNNSVFSLQKGEQDSNLEMDDLDKTDTESFVHEDRFPKESASGFRRSQTFPDVRDPAAVRSVSIECTDYQFSDSLDVHTPLMSSARQCPTFSSELPRRSDLHTRGSIQRAVTVAAIHHQQPTADSTVTLLQDDDISPSDVQHSALRHLCLQLHRKGRKGDDSDVDDDDDDDEGDVHQDQTRALLKC